LSSNLSKQLAKQPGTHPKDSSLSSLVL